ncbi:MAG: efflux transporter outer membrane subunit [Terracidiphilus sp.]|jgi:NodT family efflux transporter outer membrane factor (OMF) lipoprotein
MNKSMIQSRDPAVAWRVLSLAAILAMMAGCNVGPKYLPPTATAPQAYKESPVQFKESGEWTVAQPQDAVLRGKWWEIYNDPDLNALEGQLNIDNQNIRQAFENFMQARAMVREARSQYFPTVGIGGSYTRSQSSSNVGSAASTSTTSGKQAQVFSIPADASWEPDLWGKVRNTVRASQYTAQLTAADLENERLTEQASLAEYFFEIRGQDAQQKLLNDTVEADKKALAIAKARYDSGVDDQISVVEAQSTLDSVQSEAINLGIARAQYEDAIATLIGKTASTFSIPVEPRTSVPPPIPVGLPSQLLERRPDIAAAERNMAAANAQIRVAYAAFYPSLTLSASGGVESSAIKNLLEWPSRFWSVGPSISEAVYDGGLRRATVNQYIATYNANVAAYRQSVLIAFQQVEDSLAAVRILSQQIQRQQEAVDSNQTFLKLELGRYDTGIDPYIDVVTAQTTLLESQLTLTSLEVQEMTASVQLIAALGGGWERSQLPTPAAITEKPTKAETAIQH